MPWNEWRMMCCECRKVIESMPMFTIKYENHWPDRYLCSTECLNDFIVVAEAEVLLDNAYYA